MILYHGTNKAFDTIDLTRSKPNKEMPKSAKKTHFLERILPKYLYISIKSSNFAAVRCKNNK